MSPGGTSCWPKSVSTAATRQKVELLPPRRPTRQNGRRLLRAAGERGNEGFMIHWMLLPSVALPRRRHGAAFGEAPRGRRRDGWPARAGAGEGHTRGWRSRAPPRWGPLG